jgi:hypothetical protein
MSKFFIKRCLFKQDKEDRSKRGFTIRFADKTMQEHYEDYIKDGYHWKIAEAKTIRRFEEYDNGGK